ncbi:fibrinogen C domain-containing protein 1-like [Asterias rubens]|uniref:fibrinogen C domain-containing protein 1-like n=1 Tax=Asterias rubens TaxID=7604 RepID=UPI0014558669|nr:fibrinogen C domain-containing protein 1-like [Asterias rubens]
MTDWVGGVAYAQYDVFSIGASPGFRLNVGQYSGTAGDSMTHHNNFGFTTNDYDSDGATGGNCAIWLNGGWWYNACHRCALNGNYLIGGGVTQRDQGLQWVAWKGFYYSLKATEMKIRLLSS